MSFFIINVYGPTTWDGKEDFFAELALLKGCCKCKWVMCGDFNNTRNQDERRGKTWSSRATTLFNNLIYDLELIDLPMINQSFTWSNMQQNPTLARLDRFLVSTEWDQEFSISKVEILSIVTSDHCHILLTADKIVTRKKNIFRFEEAWLNHEDFLSKVPG